MELKMKNLFLFFIMFVVWSQMLCVVLAQEIPFDKAIKVLRASEKHLKSAKWKCKVEFKHRITREGDNKKIDSLVEQSNVNNLYAEYSVIYDCQKKLYLVDGKSCVEWYEGSHPSISSVFKFVYNGDVYFSWQRTKPGYQLPDDKDHTVGSVSKDIDQVLNVASFSTTNGAYMGFGTGFPGQITIQDEKFYGSRSLASVLEDWQLQGFPISIRELTHDKWLIEAKIILSNKAERIIRIHLLPKSGTVVDVSRVSQFRDKEYEELRVEVTTIENSKGQIVPQTIRVIRPLDYLFDVYWFSLVEINQPMHKEDFLLSFPANTYVKDFVAKKVYKVGDPVNEDKAISDFMDRYKLTGNVSVNKGYSVLNYTFMIIGGLMFIIGLFFTIRKLRLRL
jgi:hypothetical protein